jgi:dTDP-4-dehydrorhamnose reductase
LIARRILLTGASGGLGRVLYHSLEHAGHQVLGTGLRQAISPLECLDLRDRAALDRVVQTFEPEVIIHTVALTDVDRCEREPALAEALNVQTTQHVCAVAAQQGAKVIHVSTCDVFSGLEGMYREADIPDPVNVYARTKYQAEQIVAQMPSALIVRLTFVAWFVAGKPAFPAWLARQLQTRQRVGLFVDQFNAPLSVFTAADWIARLLDAQGLYHLASERISRWQVGCDIAKGLGLPLDLLDSVRLVDAGLFAQRPADVSLCGDKLAQDWQLHTTWAQELAILLAHRPELTNS